MILLWILLIANMFFALFIMLKCIKGRQIDINYIFLFSLGFILYWLLPIFIKETHLIYIINFPLKERWITIYNSISAGRMSQFLLFSFLLYVAFWCGSLVRFNNKNEEKSLNNYKVQLYCINIFLIIIGAGLLFFIYQFRNSLFTGYQEIDWKQAALKGDFVGTSLLFLSFFLIKKVIQNKSGKKVTLKIFFVNIETIFLLIVEIIILSLGTRIYFLIYLLSLTVFVSTFIARFRLKIIALIGSGIIALLAVIGALRYGFSFEKINLTDLITNLTQEYMLNSFSLISSIHFHDWGIIKFPLYLLRDLSTGAYLPLEWLNAIKPNFVPYSPVGGTNLFYSLIINFGIVGSLLFAFLFSMLINYLGTRSTAYSMAAYACISATLALSFFRDNFYISLVKICLQDFIVIPALIMLIIKSIVFFYQKIECRSGVYK